jgi:TetR/AcrR family transcriptional repressor of mexJK operon
MASHIPKTEHNHRARVLQAATQLVLCDGFDASMEMVADAAGVSKQTVYSYFDSKDALFCEVVRGLARPAWDSIACEGGGIACTLQDIAGAYEAAQTGEGVSLGRVLLCEAPRSLPALRELLHTIASGMSERLSRCMADTMEKGLMRRDDPDVAAGLFLAMLTGIEGDKSLFPRAVTLFKQAYDIRQPHGAPLPRA